MTIDFQKQNGLVPAVIQHAQTKQVLMVGYMNSEAFEKTKKEGKVTFFSRSKQRLWTKGETSENYLFVESISVDCDNDTLLIQCMPAGPTCHTGTSSCFGNDTNKSFLFELEQIIEQRATGADDSSYTNRLLKEGINKIAQKVGEEAIETVIEAKDDNDTLFKNEVSDLLYHLLVLLKAKKISLQQIEDLLQSRHKK